MENRPYSAGFSRLDITPPLGVALPGSWNHRVGTGVLDPLYVNAVAFQDGEQTAVLLVLDLLGTYQKMASWHAKIAEVAGLAPESVFLCATHSHTTPAVARDDSDELYDKWLFRRQRAVDLPVIKERQSGRTAVLLRPTWGIGPTLV